MSSGNDNLIYTSHGQYVKAFFNMETKEDLSYSHSRYSVDYSYCEFRKVSSLDVRRLLSRRVDRGYIMEKYWYHESSLNNNLEMF